MASRTPWAMNDLKVKKYDAAMMVERANIKTIDDGNAGRLCKSVVDAINTNRTVAANNRQRANSVISYGFFGFAW